MVEPWFSEPELNDGSFRRPEEEMVSWLSRSTNEAAKECRGFLNVNLSKLPPDFAKKVHKDLEFRWESAFFELIVGRTLQVLGANIVHETPIASSGRKPDFQAIFPDVEITVEAMSPIFDGEVRKELDSDAKLLKILEKIVPEGVSVWVQSLPNIGPSDSKKEFKRHALQLLQPPFNWDENAPYETRATTLSSGRFKVTLHPRGLKAPKISAGPAYGGFSDSTQRILHAVEEKRDQVRGADRPVVLAINASGISSSFEDFDRALLGSETGISPAA